MSKAVRYRSALVHAGLEIALAMNGLQIPEDTEWVRKHAQAALDIINEALEKA
ncbi:hypothetical protein [Gelria sp. Kuro-4]|uniref:hypothetical protein n=1 Tax=Gelria sp. Kuro-4 TaxID=2796927 RepID=UPI001BF0F8EE|nr:hypothetical protein [Gelria sp. Kuro-4]BCV23318.1 hypothetical protein kuro4_00910 [Gelria sp. Kuro-4]